MIEQNETIDWQEIELSELVQPERKITYGIVQPGEYTEHGILLVRGKDYSKRWAPITDFFRVSKEIDRPYQRSKLCSGDILLTIVGANTGNVAMVPDWLTGANITQTTARIAIDSDKASNYYLKFYFESDLGRRLIYTYQKGGAQPGLNLSDIAKFKVCIPPLPEQRKIAAILGTWDEAIAQVEQLIAALKQRKKGLMQRLLTGKVRFPGFEGEWESIQTPLAEVPKDWNVTKFGEVFKMNSGSTPTRTRPDFFEGDNLWVTSGELNYGLINDTYEKISHEAIVETGLKLYPKGTFMIAITGLEAAGTRGRCGVLGKPATVNQSCMALESNGAINTHYLLHFYNQFSQHIATRYAQGTKQQSLPKKILTLVPIFYPETNEQKKIVELLNLEEEQIEKHTYQLKALKKQKKGLMQRLLTGQIRVNVDEEAHV